jgi:hypothetical protein
MSCRAFIATIVLAAGLALSIATTPAQGATDVPLVFPPGSASVMVSGNVEGRDDTDYVYVARGGERLTATLEGDTAVYFNVLPPGSNDVAIFNGSIAGARYEGVLDAPGEYRLRVYQMRASGRRGEVHAYRLNVSVDPPPAAAPALAGPLTRSLTLHGIRFDITSPNLARGNTLRIVPRGLTDDSEIVQAVDGIVVDAEIADLNVDQAPEVYIYVREPGADARLSLVAYASNRNRSLSGIHLPPLDETPGAADGYRGNDAMAVVESVFARRFPIAGGGTRQLQYRLAHGEASWILKFDRMTEF